MGESVRNSIWAIPVISGFIIRSIIILKPHQTNWYCNSCKTPENDHSLLSGLDIFQPKLQRAISCHLTLKTKHPCHSPCPYFQLNLKENLCTSRDHGRGVQNVPIRESMFTNIISESLHTLNNRTESAHKARAAARKCKSVYCMNARCMYKQLCQGEAAKS